MIRTGLLRYWSSSGADCEASRYHAVPLLLPDVEALFELPVAPLDDAPGVPEPPDVPEALVLAPPVLLDLFPFACDELSPLLVVCCSANVDG